MVKVGGPAADQGEQAGALEERVAAAAAVMVSAVKMAVRACHLLHGQAGSPAIESERCDKFRFWLDKLAS